MTKKKILEKAKAEGVKVHKGNKNKAEPLEKICGQIKAKYPTKVRDLLNCL